MLKRVTEIFFSAMKNFIHTRSLFQPGIEMMKDTSNLLRFFPCFKRYQKEKSNHYLHQ